MAAALTTPDGLAYERRPVDMFFPKRLTALAGGTCGQCDKLVADKAQWSEVDVAEYLISATCPPCWARMMTSEDDDDDDLQS